MIIKTPLRLSLVGGGSDLRYFYKINGGKSFRKQKNIIIKILHKLFLNYFSYSTNNKIILFLLYFKKNSTK